MKKILVLVIALMVSLCSIAFAAGNMQHCDLCGREHAGTRCPEACQNDCVWNIEGVTHKWYDCPEYIVTSCWYCGDTSGIHNANTCPNGEVFWNDIKGTFRAIEYKGEEGTRLPEFCEFCDYYGYHSSSECVNNPNPSKPEPTKTPKPTNSPKPTKTPIATKLPTWENNFCDHSNLSTKYSDVISVKNMTSEYCQVKKYKVVLICTNCDYETEETREEKIPHQFTDGECCICGYGSNGPTLNNWTPNDSTNDKTPSSKPSTCTHEGSTTLFRVGNYWYENGGNVCIEYYNQEIYCNKCNTTVETKVIDTELEHKFSKGKCLRCDAIKPEEATPSPSPSPAPTSTPDFSWLEDVEVNPTFPPNLQDSVTEQQPETASNYTWIIVIAMVVAVILICFIYKRFRRRIRRSRAHR